MKIGSAPMYIPFLAPDTRSKAQWERTTELQAGGLDIATAFFQARADQMGVPPPPTSSELVSRPAEQPKTIDAAFARLDETGPDEHVAAYLAVMAELSYQKRCEVQAKCEAGGKCNFKWFDEGRDTQAFGFTMADRAILVFRGTESLRDWITDLQAWPSGSPRRHYGFTKAWQEIASPIRDWLATLSTAKLVLTGHSLGGALAIMAAFELRRLCESCEVQAVVTFGAPRVGLEDFAEVYAKTRCGARSDRTLDAVTVRYRHRTDVISRVPPGIRYRHIGKGRVISVESIYDDKDDHGIIRRLVDLGRNLMASPSSVRVFMPPKGAAGSGLAHPLTAVNYRLPAQSPLESPLGMTLRNLAPALGPLLVYIVPLTLASLIAAMFGRDAHCHRCRFYHDGLARFSLPRASELAMATAAGSLHWADFLAVIEVARLAPLPAGSKPQATP